MNKIQFLDLQSDCSVYFTEYPIKGTYKIVRLQNLFFKCCQSLQGGHGSPASAMRTTCHIYIHSQALLDIQNQRQKQDLHFSILSRTECVKSQSPSEQESHYGSTVRTNSHSEEQPRNQDGTEVLLINLGSQVMKELHPCTKSFRS